MTPGERKNGMLWELFPNQAIITVAMTIIITIIITINMMTIITIINIVFN